MDEKIIYAAGGAVAGALVSAGATYLILMKRFTTSFNEALDEAVETEVAATKKFYATLTKEDYPSPDDLIRERGLKFEQQMAEGRVDVQELIGDLEYTGEEDDEKSDADMTPVAKNVFTNYANTSGWDADAEAAQRDPSKPYVISADEFFENEPDYIQTQLTYFAEDGILADGDDKPVDESVVGEENLQKFGHGSKDPNIVYIRNETLDIDLEVLYAEGNYSEQVHGFIQHGASPSRALRKFRLDE